MTEQVKSNVIPFHGANIRTAQENGTIYVALKPICEHLGITWQGQQHKVKAHEAFNQSIRYFVLPSNGGPQSTLCMPLDMALGWLCTIHPNKVDKSLRDLLIAYQKESFTVVTNWLQKARLPSWVLPSGLAKQEKVRVKKRLNKKKLLQNRLKAQQIEIKKLTQRYESLKNQIAAREMAQLTLDFAQSQAQETQHATDLMHLSTDVLEEHANQTKAPPKVYCAIRVLKRTCENMDELSNSVDVHAERLQTLDGGTA